MSVPSTVRARRSRIRRTSVALLLASGLSVTGSAVVSAGAPAPIHAPAQADADVVGLKYGAYGNNVRALQQALIRVGVGVKYGVDGYFGSATRASVKAFQNYKGLPVTGVVDEATARALGFRVGPSTSGSALAVGSTGAAVKELQQLLIAAGVDVGGGVDGVYGFMTANAVKRFQQAKGLPATGVVDQKTAAALGVGGGGTTPQPATQPLTQAPANNATSIVGLRLGARGPAVVTLQKAIISMGWRINGGADGVFGPATQEALIKAQKANGVPGTGVVDEATARLFNLTSTPNTSTPANPAGGGSTAAGFAAYDERGERVVALQKALMAAGISLRGGADGVFGSATAAGILAFQQAKGLPATGKVDAATAAALGLKPMDPPAAPPAVNVTLEAKPVQGPCYYGDTWTASRGNGRVHLGVDIAAKEGNELYAAITGTVTKIYTPETDQLAGNGLRITRPDGTYVFYAHLQQLAPGIGVGSKVTAGQLVGYVGKTGNAGVPHLHLEIHPGGGSAVNPYPIVKAIGAC